MQASFWNFKLLLDQTIASRQLMIILTSLKVLPYCEIYMMIDSSAYETLQLQNGRHVWLTVMFNWALVIWHMHFHEHGLVDTQSEYVLRLYAYLTIAFHHWPSRVTLYTLSCKAPLPASSCVCMYEQVQTSDSDHVGPTWGEVLLIMGCIWTCMEYKN